MGRFFDQAVVSAIPYGGCTMNQVQIAWLRSASRTMSPAAIFIIRSLLSPIVILIAPFALKFAPNGTC